MTRRSALSVLGGLVAIAGLAVALMLLGVIPVRAYVNQQRELASTSSRLHELNTRNRQLRERVKVLQTDREVTRIAREQFGLVHPGEKLVLISGLRSQTSTFGGQDPDAAAVQPVPPAPAAAELSVLRVLMDAVAFWR
jgi:cell division protein FtsB